MERDVALPLLERRICFAVIAIVFVVPVILRPLELSYSFAPGDTQWIVMDTCLLATDRLVTAPIFLVFVFEAYVLVRVVKGYGERIKIWPQDYKAQACELRNNSSSTHIP